MVKKSPIQMGNATWVPDGVQWKSRGTNCKEATKGTSLDQNPDHIVAGSSMRFLKGQEGHLSCGRTGIPFA